MGEEARLDTQRLSFHQFSRVEANKYFQPTRRGKVNSAVICSPRITLDEPVSVVFKVYCLSVMTMVAATYTVVLRYTRTISSTAMYFSTTAVCVTEVIKLFLSLGMLTKEAGSFGRLKASIVEHVFQCPKELLKLSVPSVVYAIQNNMAFIALSNLDAAVYQVTYQLKIPCTALCMVLMLNRSLSRLQWLSVCMLCGGVALVQWKPAEATKVQVEQNPFWGFMAIAIAVFCSGFAGVYFEKVLKSSDTSLWVRNIQMYLSGIVVTLAVVYMTEGTQVIQKGFFYGYTPWVCFAVFLASVGGLYTSVVVKYTDNIMKGFSAAAAIVLSTVASVALFGLQITVNFASGAMLVCISIYLYGLPKQDTTKLPRADKDAKQKLITV
ncbi:CMP-sialic acid transporter isoform X1 [Oncorhynchus kisutch]|uniref:CMP-sialic acid transporter isoform X1 n=1 Tax=Oncorhynchus kisutch TaxID=8019 RepID=UPI0012DCD296|nr:CMP-sialic acid transporter isoform X1 [Oncorhynchus kisutch]XP_031692901.1 CMP-sialic acid transporter isoform X1 [Oncorhynchus kisutch]XP_031692902.1 CMP-sialic acid transporter isoform X1 [Oncorhynchus kisutch]XP_031692903.1 CMP-sialic acid transporter isoform X1 [Oncorhynchus kisutch]XP_031692904.1 CMP-sialic acid transporter isoform X1 [Oncorhynchus kisutch]